MGDSDDEFDRRRRDKFRRERNDYERRDSRENRERGGGGQWEERGGRMGWDKRDRRDNYREFDRRRERYSPNGRQDISPPMKRFRGDWEDRGGGGDNFGGGYGGGHGHHGGWGGASGGGDMGPPHHGGFNPQRNQEPEYPTQPPMMSFKQFLSSQDDNITDEESIKKYNEYKIDFKKQQINEFFLAHKEEEWFKAKYSPEEFERRQQDANKALQHRCDVFSKLLEMSMVNSCPVDADHTEDLVRLLDAAVILMEGGTEKDIRSLEVEAKSVPEEKETRTSRQNSEAQASSDHEEGSIPDKTPTAAKSKGPEDELEDDEKEEGEEDDDADKSVESKADEETEAKKEKPVSKKKRRDYNSDSGSDSESGSASDSDAESSPKRKPSENAENDMKDSPEAKLSKKEATKTSEDKEADTAAAEDGEHKDENKPQALHKTHSIFLRNLAPTITRQEVEAMCKRFPGFLRVALQDPQPERRFFRRGWVTFDRTVNIKEICWNLNNIRLRDCEMGAIVNRELKQRVRPVNGITGHKTITKQDIKHAAKIVQNFDNRWNLWPSHEEKKDEDKDSKMSMSFGLVSNNPVLKNITDYLVDEGSYEEEAYFGECMDDKSKEANPDFMIERDPELCQVLDRMILYLRIVHSFDYYSGVEYPNEDEMPHRCGIMHARGSSPANRVTQHDLNEWNNQYESRISHYLNYKWQMDNDEAIRLGRKDADAEVEKFVTANTQELAKDKWLCPLSGKKFKGPEFIKKHLFNKHAEKIEEVRQEVAYFNNYLTDPKRPHLPEHPSSRQGVVMQPPARPDTAPSGYMPQNSGYHGGGGGGGFRGNMGGGYSRPPMYNNYQGRGRGQKRGYHHSPNYHGRGGGDHYRQDFRRGGGGGGGGFYRRDRGRQDPRGIIEYRDLDAPEDSDMF